MPASLNFFGRRFAIEFFGKFFLFRSGQTIFVDCNIGGFVLGFGLADNPAQLVKEIEVGEEQKFIVVVKIPVLETVFYDAFGISTFELAEEFV